MYTTGRAVSLTLNGNEATQMCISDTTTCSSRETLATSKSRTLMTGEGTKTVYVQFRDAAENISAQYSDTIILDTTKPI
jgi:hypothetical protein